jgi:hypothetical protein
MRSARIAAAVFVGLLSLAACSGKTKSKDNVAIPKELSDIVSSTNFQRVWASHVKTDGAERGEHLTPAVFDGQILIAVAAKRFGVSR